MMHCFMFFENFCCILLSCVSLLAGIRGGLMNRPAAPPQAAFQQTQPATPQAFVTQQYPTAAPTGGQDYGRAAVRYSVIVALTVSP